MQHDSNYFCKRVNPQQELTEIYLPRLLFRVFGQLCLGNWLHKAGNVIETHEHAGDFKDAFCSNVAK
jgi:hypothetical protein